MNHVPLSPDQPPLRILWTMPYVPWPTTNGGKVTRYSLLRQMAARGHAITLLCLAKEMPDDAARAHLLSFLDALVVVPRRPRTSARTLLRATFSLGRPTLATINGCNHDYARLFASQLGRGFDIVHAEHSYAFEPLERTLREQRIPFLLNEHNVESSVVEMQYRWLPAPLRPLARLDAVRARHWERRVLRQAACVTACAPGDRDAFLAMGARAVLLPNGIDMAPFAGVTRDIAARRVAFLGNYEYRPNVDAVQWLCDEIMPLVWAAEPQARLAVHGFAMPPTWRARWPDPRLEFAGFAGSIAQVHAASTVFVAPLRAGGGSKLKVLEAMASGMPVVSTQQGLTGLNVLDGVHALHGETATELAAALVCCLREPVMATALGERARQLVAREHDWNAIGDELERIYRTYLCTAVGAPPGWGGRRP